MVDHQRNSKNNDGDGPGKQSRPPSDTTINQNSCGHGEVYGEANANAVDVEGK